MHEIVFSQASLIRENNGMQTNPFTRLVNEKTQENKRNHNSENLRLKPPLTAWLHRQFQSN